MQERHLFLFDNLLVIAKSNAMRNTYMVKEILFTNELFLLDMVCRSYVPLLYGSTVCLYKSASCRYVLSN